MTMAANGSEVNLSNWRESPYNQWAFRNIDKVLKTETIKKPDRPSPLDRQLRSFDGFQIDIQGHKLDLPAFIGATNTDGLVVLHHGKIVYEEYFTGNDEHSKHIIMSMTKSVTALLVGILQEQGRLNVNDLVTKYVPEVQGTLYEGVTIQQCIDMRSGVVYADNSQEYRAAMGWNPFDGSEKHDNLHDFLQNFDAKKAPHDGFEYVSANTDLVGWVIERASGKQFAEAVQELIWQPMGAESDALVSIDSKGNARAAGGLCATLRDVARIGQLIVDDGPDVIPPAFLHDIVNGGDKEVWAKGSWTAAFPGFPNLAYRSHCVADSSLDLVMGLGIHGQMLFADRKHGIVMAMTGSQAEAVDGKAILLSVRAYQEVLRILTV